MEQLIPTFQDLSCKSNISIQGIETTISLIPFADVDFLIISQTPNFGSLVSSLSSRDVFNLFYSKIMIENKQARHLVGSRDILYDIYAQHILQEFNPTKPLLLSIGLKKHSLELFDNDVELEEYKKVMSLIMKHVEELLLSSK